MGNYLIDEYLRGPKGLDMDDFYEEFWNYNKYDGCIASLPFNNSTPVLFYNKDILRQAGLEPKAPRPGMSWWKWPFISGIGLPRSVCATSYLSTCATKTGCSSASSCKTAASS